MGWFTKNAGTLVPVFCNNILDHTYAASGKLRLYIFPILMGYYCEKNINKNDNTGIDSI